MKGLRLLCAAGLMIVMTAGAIHAQDEAERKITFTVPVELRLIHENVYSVWLELVVKDAQGQIVGRGPGDSIRLDASTGAYSGRERIEVVAVEGQDIMNAVSYEIKLLFHYRSSAADSEYSGVLPTVDHEHIEVRPRPDTDFVVELTGDIEW